MVLILSEVEGPTMAVQSLEADAPRRRARNRTGAFSPLWLLPVLLFMVAFFVAPLVENGIRGFYPTETSGFSLAIYVKFATDPFYLGVLARTVGLSLVV